jgi:hypothetical protein
MPTIRIKFTDIVWDVMSRDDPEDSQQLPTEWVSKPMTLDEYRKRALAVWDEALRDCQDEVGFTIFSMGDTEVVRQYTVRYTAEFEAVIEVPIGDGVLDHKTWLIGCQSDIEPGSGEYVLGTWKVKDCTEVDPNEKT